MNTPFTVGRPVTGAKLIGREKEIKDIIDLVLDNQSLVIMAPRRYGKTSLLLHTLNLLNKKGIIPVYIDLFSIVDKRMLAEKIVISVLETETNKIKELFNIIKTNVSELLKNTKFKAVVENFEFILDFSDNRIKDDVLLDRALSFIEEFAKKRKKHLVFAFDEFNDISKLNDSNILKLMRSHFQRHENVTYVFCGSQESIMKDIFQGKASAFYRFARILNIGFINKERFVIYIMNVFKKLEISIGKDLVSFILDKTNGHPYYTQLLCQFLYYEIKGTDKIVSEKDIEQAGDSLFEKEKPVYDEIWGSLGNKKYYRRVLLNLANDESAYVSKIDASTVRRVLSGLEDLGYIERLELGKYAFKNEFFKKYIKEFI